MAGPLWLRVAYLLLDARKNPFLIQSGEILSPILLAQEIVSIHGPERTKKKELNKFRPEKLRA